MRHPLISSGRELDAAGITASPLRAAYERCRALHARHGRTYFLATRLLPPDRRPAVHALYGFARHVDDLVDEPIAGSGPDEAAPGPDTEGGPAADDGADAAGAITRIAARLDALAAALDEGLRAGRSDHPLLAAVVDTAVRFRVGAPLFAAFLRSMRMDLTVTGYPSRAALLEYVHGSAEVIGLQMLPVLGTVSDPAEAAPRAAALGRAFQLTNFLRDVAEDLGRGRVYLPADELAAHGVDRDLLGWCRRTGRIEPRVRAALADQVARTRADYRRARPGVAMLRPASRPCVATAVALYGGILDRIEGAGYNVFAGRVAVGAGRRLSLAGTAFPRAWWIRAAYARPRSDRPRAGGPRAGEPRRDEARPGEPRSEAARPGGAEPGGGK